MIISHNLVLCRENSSLELIINYDDDLVTDGFHSGFTKIYIESGAKANIYKMQGYSKNATYFDSTVVFVEENAEVNIIDIQLGSGLKGTNYDVQLKGDNSSCQMKSIYIGTGEDKMDFSYNIKYLGRRTNGFIEVKEGSIVYLDNGATTQKPIRVTEGLNFLAYSYGLSKLKEGDEILLSITNHHSNIVPWQMVARRTGAKLVYLICDKNGQITKEDIENKINKNTKIISISHVSNVFGVIHPIEYIVKKGRENQATIIIDGAQSVPHLETNVNELEPFLYGGDMIEYVDLYETSYGEIPY